MAKYHVSPDGNPRVCSAPNGKCPFGGDETHYTSKEAARAAFEASEVIPEPASKKVDVGESVRTVNEWGDVYWLNANGELHRDGDLPAIENPDGSKAWYRNGQRHRDGDLPAIEDADGSKLWCQNGLLSRDGDLPATEYADGSKEWWVNGIFQYRISPDGTRANGLPPKFSWWQAWRQARKAGDRRG